MMCLNFEAFFLRLYVFYSFITQYRVICLTGSNNNYSDVLSVILTFHLIPLIYVVCFFFFTIFIGEEIDSELCNIPEAI